MKQTSKARGKLKASLRPVPGHNYLGDTIPRGASTGYKRSQSRMRSQLSLLVVVGRCSRWSLLVAVGRCWSLSSAVMASNLFEVEVVKGIQCIEGETSVLVKWVGFERETWEPIDHLYPNALKSIQIIFMKLQKELVNLYEDKRVCHLYSISTPSPNYLQEDLIVAHDKDVINYLNRKYGILYRDQFKILAVEMFENCIAASSASMEHVKVAPISCPSSDILHVQGSVGTCIETVELVEKGIKELYSQVQELNLRFTIFEGVIETGILTIGKVGLNRMLKKVIEKLNDEKRWNLKVYCQVDAPHKHFSASRVDFGVFKSDGESISAMLVLPDEVDSDNEIEDGENIVGLTGEASLYQKDKIAQLFGGMINTASIIVAEKLKMGNLVKTVSVYGLTPVWSKEESGALMIQIDFVNKRILSFKSSDCLPLAKAFALGIAKVVEH